MAYAVCFVRLPCAPRLSAWNSDSRAGHLEELELALLDDETAARGELCPVEGGEVGLEDGEPLVAVGVQGEAGARRLEQGLEPEVAAEEGSLALGHDELVVVDARL